MNPLRIAALVIASLCAFSASANDKAATQDTHFYAGANVGWATNLPDWGDDDKFSYGATVGVPLDNIFALEADFNYLARSQNNVDLDVYAIDVAVKAGYEIAPKLEGFVKAGYSYMHANADTNAIEGNTSLHLSASDHQYKPMASVGVKADYGSYYSIFAYNHFFADDLYDISAVTVSFGFNF